METIPEALASTNPELYVMIVVLVLIIAFVERKDKRSREERKEFTDALNLFTNQFGGQINTKLDGIGDDVQDVKKTVVSIEDKIDNRQPRRRGLS